MSVAWKWPGSSNDGVGEEWTGFINPGVSLEGTLTLKGTFRIDGHVKGNIISEQAIILGENAKVNSDPNNRQSGRRLPSSHQGECDSQSRAHQASSDLRDLYFLRDRISRYVTTVRR